MRTKQVTPTAPPPPLHPSTKRFFFFKYFLRVAQTAARHCIEGVREGQVSFPLGSQQSIWKNFVADWRINITARQPKTFLHGKKTRPISELKHTFRTTPRSGQCLTHSHIYITLTVKENSCSLTDGKREIQREQAEKLELILAISINYWT